MSKHFNKLFRKSVSLTPGELQQQQQYNNSTGNLIGSSSAPRTLPPSSNSTGSLGNSSGSSGSAPSSPLLSHSPSNHSPSSNSPTSNISPIHASITNSPSKSNSALVSQSSSSSQINLIKQQQDQQNFPTLPLIDFDIIFSSYLKEGDQLKHYFLVHSILAKKGSSSSGNLLKERSQSVSKSWQPFFKKNSYPCFLVLSQRFIILVDSSTYPFTINRKIPLVDLKEIIFDSTDLGIFSIELNSSGSQLGVGDFNNIFYFSIGCEKKDVSDLILNSIEEVLRDQSIFNKGNSIIKKIKLVGEIDQKDKNDFKDHVNVLLDDMSILGFSAQDLWEGNTDLKFWVDKIKDKIKLYNDERYVVEFILPDLGNNNERKKMFRVPNNISVVDITHFLCSRLNISDFNIYTLSTIKGMEFDGKDNLSDYGLGSFFDNWQLCLIEKGKTRKAGLFNLEVHFPDGSEFLGRHHRIIEVDGYMLVKKLVKYISDQMDISKSHLYSLRLEIPSTNNAEINKAQPSNIVLDDNDYLTSFGLGTRFNKCKLKFVPKKFPKAFKEHHINLNIVKSIFDDVIENAWEEYSERKSYKSTLLCKDIVYSIVDTAYTESLRASTLAVRIASLSSVSRAIIYKLLSQKEQEEINFYKLPGQARIANEAKDHINNLTPLLGPSLDVTLEEDENTLKIRVPPPPPPPILGFKNFKSKREQQSTIQSNTPGQPKVILSPGIQNVDMNAILGMRGKLRATTKEETQNSNIGGSKINITLRSTKQPAKPLPASSQETTELMLKFQKRNANINLAEAEELGDS